MIRYRFTVGPDGSSPTHTFATLDIAVSELARASKRPPMTIHLYDTATLARPVIRCTATAGQVVWWSDCRACRGTGKTGKLVCVKCLGGGRVADHG